VLLEAQQKCINRLRAEADETRRKHAIQARNVAQALLDHSFSDALFFAQRLLDELQ
jgi:hypothetical protein